MKTSMVCRVGLAALTALLVLTAVAPSAQAEPTPVNRSMTWEHPGDARLAGFYVYVAPESENPRVYSNARRFQIADPAKRSAVVLDLFAQASDRICFKVTAYTAAMVGPPPVASIESDFSNEACGNFGYTKPTNVIVE